MNQYVRKLVCSVCAVVGASLLLYVGYEQYILAQILEESGSLRAPSNYELFQAMSIMKLLIGNMVMLVAILLR